MKLAICLRYLASECSMKDLHYSYKVGVSTISGIIWDVCWTLWHVLQGEYLQTLSTEILDGGYVLKPPLRHRTSWSIAGNCDMSYDRQHHCATTIANEKENA
ncbi:hypothetical protein EVAR_80891_1 [Eumeta japonica]|uniref:Transposase Helix-turn-helix domain-containing protein n=1 Tax=Eumeta variegata TaxID=151549 RepID=A0A4C1V079_EUMVA|nr:hypothetical protein EVAR_80891_1 [Eumeta japonica]